MGESLRVLPCLLSAICHGQPRSCRLSQTFSDRGVMETGCTLNLAPAKINLNAKIHPLQKEDCDSCLLKGTFTRTQRVVCYPRQARLTGPYT